MNDNDKDNDNDNKQHRKVAPQPLADGGEPPPISEAHQKYLERRRLGWRSSAAIRPRRGRWS